MQRKFNVINAMVFPHKQNYEWQRQQKHSKHTGRKRNFCYFKNWNKIASIKWRMNVSHQAGPHAPKLPNTIALQIRTRFLQKWLWRWRTCSATACPQTLSKGHACTMHPAHWRAQSARCFGHLWREYVSSSLKSQRIYQHPVRALKHPSVSGSGKPSGGGSSARKEVRQMSSVE